MPPLSTRVSERSAEVTKSSISFRFNCSWFSDVNGAIRFFAVVVTESEGSPLLSTELTLSHTIPLVNLLSSFLHVEGADEVQPQHQDPLPSYLDYKTNSSVKTYQTSYFPSQCSEGPDSSRSFHLTLGTGMDSLGGSCERRDLDPQTGRDLKLFCDGPLKPNTAYRYCTVTIETIINNNNMYDIMVNLNMVSDGSVWSCLQAQCPSVHSAV